MQYNHYGLLVSIVLELTLDYYCLVFGPHLYSRIGNKTSPLKSPNNTIPKYILK